MDCVADLMSALHIAQYPARWDSLYKTVMKEFSECGEVFPEQEYLLMLHKEYHLFERTLDDIFNVAAKIRKKPELMKYIILLNIAMQDRDTFRIEVGSIEPPHAQGDEDTAPYDLALLFAVLPTIPETAKRFHEHGVPSDICYATFAGYEECVIAFQKRYNRLGFDVRYLSWTQLYIDTHILRIGRLNFEMRARFGGGVYVLLNTYGKLSMLMTDTRMHRNGMVLGIPGYEDEDGAYDADFVETADYYEGYLVGTDGHAKSERSQLPKSEWQIVLSPDDPVISVHIPAGGNLSPELCESAYARAREIFGSCYPEFRYKAFVCFSWLMDPQLNKLLPVDSKIINFQSKYLRFPRPSSGKAVLDFVFLGRFDCYENLPENTSLERSLKQHYLSGKYIYEQGGVFF